jgi:hypothetical protein
VSIALKAITAALGYEQITSVSASTALNVPQRDLNGLLCKPVMAVIICEGQPVRWRDDSVAPTASVGMPLVTGVALLYDGNLSQIRFIEQTAGAKLNVSYYT